MSLDINSVIKSFILCRKLTNNLSKHYSIWKNRLINIYDNNYIIIKYYNSSIIDDKYLNNFLNNNILNNIVSDFEEN